MQRLKYIVTFIRQFFLRICAQLTSTPFSEEGSILIIAPHPDDEVLGCGGLIANQTANKQKTNILFVTKGEASHNGCCDTSTIEIATQRCHCTISSNEILGVPKEHLHFLEGEDGSLPRKGQDGFNELALKIASYIEKSKPEIIFCPHPFEGWSDHMAAEELTISALKMIKILPMPPPRLYHYCVWFWYSMPLRKAWHIDWQNSHLLDISKQTLLKQQAMENYLNALSPCGNPWIGKLPPQFLRAFNWNKELFFEVHINLISNNNQ
jgi:LmbE family N-acetylglucosaminyl deacetylase